MTGLPSLEGRLTLKVPEAGRLLYDLGRDASYAAAERGEIPCLRVGRRLVVPTITALTQLGWSEELIARALGLEPEISEAPPASGAHAQIHALAKQETSSHDDTPPHTPPAA